jgi:hypothetical protein
MATSPTLLVQPTSCPHSYRCVPQLLAFVLRTPCNCHCRESSPHSQTHVLIRPQVIDVHVEWLISHLDDLPISRGWFVLILIPFVSAFDKRVAAVSVAVQDQLAVAMAVVIGSAIPPPIIVIPCVMLLGWTLGRPIREHYPVSQ